MLFVDNGDGRYYRSGMPVVNLQMFEVSDDLITDLLVPSGDQTRRTLLVEDCAETGPSLPVRLFCFNELNCKVIRRYKLAPIIMLVATLSVGHVVEADVKRKYVKFKL